MVRKLSLAGLAIITLLVTQVVASEPAITGHVEGLELCPESLCGAAFFIGKFTGRVNQRRATGGFFVSINHDPLPAPGRSVNITGGDWTIRANLRLFSGEVLGGTISNNGDNTFAVEAVLQVTFGGSGEIFVRGELDHNQFPPTNNADLSQPPALVTGETSSQ